MTTLKALHSEGGYLESAEGQRLGSKDTADKTEGKMQMKL